MKFKKIFTCVSLVMAGAFSTAAFADTQDSTQAQLDSMKAQIAQMQAAIDANNASTGLPSLGWSDRIKLGGLANFDGMYAKRFPTTFGHGSPSRLAVRNANLFVDANVSEWTKAHVGLVYSNFNSDFDFLRAGAFDYKERESSNDLKVDEAYVTIANFAKSPLYLKAGKQYLPFGSYKPYQDLTPSFTQILSQVNGNSVVAGFANGKGVYGSVYGLQGIQKVSKNGNNAIRNFGASFGFNSTYNSAAYNLGVDYIHNMADVTGIKYGFGKVEEEGVVNTRYIKATSGLAANAGIKYNAFDADAKYVTALKHFDRQDVEYNGRGAKPSAWTVDAGYNFPVNGHDSRFGLTYQGTAKASGINVTSDSDYVGYGLPKTRYGAEYKVNVSKYTDLGLGFNHDIDYGKSAGGTGRSSNTGIVRLAVMFA